MWGRRSAEHQQNWRKGKTGRQCGSSTRGKQSGPSEKHPQNNLYQNSFCQQILWRETPFRHNPLMHSRAHIQQHTRLSPPLTNKQYETQCSMLGLLVWSLCSLFIHGGKLLKYLLILFNCPVRIRTLKHFYLMATKTRSIWFMSFQLFVKNALNWN